MLIEGTLGIDDSVRLKHLVSTISNINVEGLIDVFFAGWIVTQRVMHYYSLVKRS
jgi:hypothetical protein